LAQRSGKSGDIDLGVVAASIEQEMEQIRKCLPDDPGLVGAMGVEGGGSSAGSNALPITDGSAGALAASQALNGGGVDTTADGAEMPVDETGEGANGPPCG